MDGVPAWNRSQNKDQMKLRTSKIMKQKFRGVD